MAPHHAPGCTATSWPTRHALVLALLSCFAAPPAFAADTLYDSLGGQAGIERISGNAVALYLTDPRLRADFDNINPDRLRSRIASFLCRLTQGPCTYPGRSMADAHAGLPITEAKFNATAEGMQLAMKQAGVPYWTQNRLMALLAPMHRDIVNR